MLFLGLTLGEYLFTLSKVLFYCIKVFDSNISIEIFHAYIPIDFLVTLLSKSFPVKA